jgi:hypothetical protein
MASKFREIKVRASVVLPAISTVDPERPYSFLHFLSEWVCQSRGMRRDEYLAHLFEWEEAVDAFVARMAKKAGTKEPAIPQMPPPVDASDSEAVKVHTAECARIGREYEEATKAYRRAVEDAAVGESFFVSDAAFLAARESAKAALEKASEQLPNGARALHHLYEPKVLRHYHAFAQAAAVEEHDVPKQTEARAETAN